MGRSAAVERCWVGQDRLHIDMRKARLPFHSGGSAGLRALGDVPQSVRGDCPASIDHRIHCFSCGRTDQYSACVPEKHLDDFAAAKQSGACPDCLKYLHVSIQVVEFEKEPLLGGHGISAKNKRKPPPHL